jgi:hypothetical protein
MVPETSGGTTYQCYWRSFSFFRCYWGTGASTILPLFDFPFQIHYELAAWGPNCRLKISMPYHMDGHHGSTQGKSTDSVFSITFKLTLEPTQPPIQWVLEAISTAQPCSWTPASLRFWGSECITLYLQPPICLLQWYLNKYTENLTTLLSQVLPTTVFHIMYMQF